MLGVTSYLAKSQEECFSGAASVEIKWALGGDPSRPLSPTSSWSGLGPRLAQAAPAPLGLWGR